MPQPSLAVSLIVPAHNESERLADTLDLYAPALRQRFKSAFEIVVVANGCTDDTAAVARGLVGRIPEVRVVEIEAKIGKGGAVLEGFKAARAPQVVFADADGSTDPESLLALLGPLETFDVVIGSRRLEESRIPEPQPFTRRLFGLGFAATVKALFHMPYQDTQCGAKAFRLEAARELAGRVEERRWAFDVDLLLSAEHLGLSVIERPVVWSDRPGSQLKIIPTLKEVLRSLWRLKRREDHLHAGPHHTSGSHSHLGQSHP